VIEVLKAATPRPWREGDFSDDIYGEDQPVCGDFLDTSHGDWNANHALVLLAVNAYEAREARIASLEGMLRRIALDVHEPDKWPMEFAEFSPKTAKALVEAKGKREALIADLVTALGKCRTFYASQGYIETADIDAALSAAKDRQP
jgi:hypothetical protein